MYGHILDRRQLWTLRRRVIVHTWVGQCEPDWTHSGQSESEGRSVRASQCESERTSVSQRELVVSQSESV